MTFWQGFTRSPVYVRYYFFPIAVMSRIVIGMERSIRHLYCVRILVWYRHRSLVTRTTSSVQSVSNSVCAIYCHIFLSGVPYIFNDSVSSLAYSTSTMGIDLSLATVLDLIYIYTCSNLGLSKSSNDIYMLSSAT